MMEIQRLGHYVCIGYPPKLIHTIKGLKQIFDLEELERYEYVVCV